MSDKLMADKEIIDLEKKLIEKDGQEEFVREIRCMSKEQLNSKIKDLTIGIKSIKTAKKEDEELNEVKAKSRELAKPYNDSVKIAQRKSDFAVLVLAEEFGEEQ